MRKSIENEKQEIKPKTLVSVLLIFLVTAGLYLATQPGSYIKQIIQPLCQDLIQNTEIIILPGKFAAPSPVEKIPE
jgi:hypothetical protein